MGFVKYWHSDDYLAIETDEWMVNWSPDSDQFIYWHWHPQIGPFHWKMLAVPFCKECNQEVPGSLLWHANISRVKYLHKL